MIAEADPKEQDAQEQSNELCSPTEPSFEGKVHTLRKKLKELGADLMDLKAEKRDAEVVTLENKGEIMANLTLAYRHVEDSAMRLGKVLQHGNGGVSVYDKNVVGSPE